MISDIKWGLVSSTYIIWVLMATVTRSVFVWVLVPHSSGGWGYASLGSGISSIRLLHLWQHILTLANLGGVLHAVCLLNEEHTAMVLWSLHYLWSCSSIFVIDIEILIWLRTLRAIWIVVLTYLLLYRLLILRLWCSISCSESSKARTIHLLLKQVASICVMNIVL